MVSDVAREFPDVTPLAAGAGDESCARISYTAEFAETMGYLRAVLRSGEKSPRVLRLTERVVEDNAANYTAWFLRRECLDAVRADLEDELELVTRFAESSPKNYQIWYHRRAVVERLAAGAGADSAYLSRRELSFLAGVLSEDAKNYHAWSYRQFVLQRFGTWSGELAFVEGLLEADLRNNSAWNQRWFVLQHTGGFGDASVRARELAFAMDFCRRAPNNESPFNYLRGLLRLACFREQAQLRGFCESLLAELRAQYGAEGHINAANPPPLLMLLVAVLAATGDDAAASSLCDDLAVRFDTVRAKYWRYRAAQLRAPAAPAPAPAAPAAAADVQSLD